MDRDREHHDVVTDYVDHEVLDETGEKLGRVTDVVPDPATLRPRWLVVDTGHLKASHYVPVAGAYEGEDGHIVVPFTKDTVKHTVRAHSDHVLTPDVERELARQYGIPTN